MTTLLAPGIVIAERYRVESFVGEGGMQQVYRATDTSFDRLVALKIPKNNSASKRFQRSAAMSAKVTHPNVAKTLDYLEVDDRQVLIEELIPGEDLRRVMSDRFFFLDPHFSAHVFHHLASAICAVHREQVIHRDLKPSNIMVSSDINLSVVKITDFGIAKMAASEIEEGIKDATLASQTVVGAIPYMAPEVIRNRKDIGISADIWSLGAILYELLSGQLPFGERLAAVEKILAAETPPRPALLNANGQFIQLVNDLWDIVVSCLQQDPLKRPSAKQLLERCNTLCYSRERRSIGVIQTINYNKWGFITSGDLSTDTFFHVDSFWGNTSAQSGQRVCFARFPGSPRDRAHPVLLMRNVSQ